MLFRSGELVRCSLTVKREQGQIKLVNLTSRITDLLTITRLLTIFDTYDAEPAALASFENRVAAGEAAKA